MSIRIVFVSNSAAENFPQEFVSWNSKGQKLCYGNGQIGFEREVTLNEQTKKRLESAKDEKERKYIESRLSTDDYDYHEMTISCSGFDCPKYKDNKCQLEGTLKFLIVGLKGLRLWWIRTGSKWTMKIVRAMHENIRSLTSPNGDPDFGRIRGIPLLLTRELKEYALPNGIKTKKWVLSLDVADVGVDDLLALGDPKAIAGKAKEAKALLEGAQPEKPKPEEVVQAEETPRVEEKPIEETTAKNPEESTKKEPDFNPEINRNDFMSLKENDQVEVLNNLIKKKGYDESQLKKPVEKFSDSQRESFWNLLDKMEVKEESTDNDIPY